MPPRRYGGAMGPRFLIEVCQILKKSCKRGQLVPHGLSHESIASLTGLSRSVMASRPLGSQSIGLFS